MKSALKTLAIAGAALVGFTGAAMVAITTFIDPNDYKPQIEELAQQQGYPIALNGELSWQFFPRLGIAVNDAQLLGADAGQPALASVKEVRASVMVLPLLRKQVAVDHVLLDGLSANLSIDKNGNTSWQHLLKEDDQSPTASEPPSEPTVTDNKGHSLSLAANSIQLKNAEIRYIDQRSDTDIRLRPLGAEINRLNLDGIEFPVRVEWAAEINHGALKQTLMNSGSLETAVTLTQDFKHLKLKQGHLNSEMGNSDVKEKSFITLEFGADITNLLTNPTIKAHAELTPTDVKAIANNFTAQPLQTHNPKSLTRVGFNLSVAGTPDNLSINPIAITLDDTSINGKAELANQNQLQLQLTGSTINVDDYLPDANAPPAEIPEEALPEPTTDGEAPLAVLNQYSADINIGFEQISAMGIAQNTPQLTAKLADGVLKVQPLAAKINGKTTQLSGQLDAQGKLQAKLNVPTINARQLLTDLNIELPVTADNSTLQAVDLSLDASGNLDDIAINNLNFGLDQTRITGSARIRNGSDIDIKLAGTELNADRYLPPPAEATPAETEAGATQPTTPETPLDFSALQTLNAKASVTFSKLKAHNLELANLKLAANSSQGLAKLDNLSADFYQGQLKAKGQLDARSKTPSVSFTGDGQGVAIKPLLAALATGDTPQKFVLAGLANGKVTLNTQGNTVSHWMENAKANINANTQSLQLVPINIEKMVCQAVALVQGESLANIDWPALTQMQDLNVKISYANQTATIEELSAGVEQFNLGALGKVDLGKQSLDVQLPVQFSQPLTQREGCPATSSWLVGKALSLVRCKGSLLEPTQACGLDNRAIREAVKDYAEAKAKAKVEAKKDEAEQRLDEKKDRLKDKIDDELGEGTSELLKDLFKRD